MEKIKKFFLKESGAASNMPENKETTANKSLETADEAASDMGEDSVKNVYDCTLKEVMQLKELFGEREVLSEIMSEEFAVFCEERSGNLFENYKGFVKFKEVMKQKEDKGSACGKTGQEKRLHSGFAESPYRDASSGLTARQMEMAKGAGMSFREYEELLGSANIRTRNKI